MVSYQSNGKVSNWRCIQDLSYFKLHAAQRINILVWVGRVLHRFVAFVLDSHLWSCFGRCWNFWEGMTYLEEVGFRDSVVFLSHCFLFTMKWTSFFFTFPQPSVPTVHCHHSRPVTFPFLWWNIRTKDNLAYTSRLESIMQGTHDSRWLSRQLRVQELEVGSIHKPAMPSPVTHSLQPGHTSLRL